MKKIVRNFRTVNRWIREGYRHSWKFDIRETESFNSDGYCLCIVTGNLTDQDLLIIRESRYRFKTYSTQSFLNDLCNRGKIASGEYWIKGESK